YIAFPGRAASPLCGRQRRGRTRPLRPSLRWRVDPPTPSLIPAPCAFAAQGEAASFVPTLTDAVIGRPRACIRSAVVNLARPGNGLPAESPSHGGSRRPRVPAVEAQER